MDIEQYIQPIIDYVRLHQAWAAPIVFALCFAESLAFPVVYDAAKQEIDYCRKSPLVGSMQYQGARRLAARLLAP